MKKTLILLVFFALIASCCGKTTEKQTAAEDICQDDTPIVAKDISDPTNTLNGEIETLKLKYIVWACVCANWITFDDFENYQDDALGEHCIFIEPANEDLVLPSVFDPFEHSIQVTGQFYTKPDYPKGIQSIEQQPVNKAKVFHYTKIQLIDAANNILMELDCNHSKKSHHAIQGKKIDIEDI